MIIRPLQSEDWPAWHRLWTAYLAFYETTVSDEVYETSFARLLSQEDNQYRCLVAEGEVGLIGLAHFLVHRDLWSLRDICYLSDLFVDPDARGTGAGRALIAAVEEAAREAGAANLYWTTEGTNATARKLYDQIAELTPFVQYTKPV